MNIDWVSFVFGLVVGVATMLAGFVAWSLKMARDAKKGS
jgi:hypothetical protein